MSDFNMEEFLTRELKDLNNKLDNNTETLNTNISQLRTCIHNKVDEVKTDVNSKFLSHAELHMNNAKSFISTKLFIFAMVMLLGGLGTVFTYAINNKSDITAIKTKHEIELKIDVKDKKVDIINEESLLDKDAN